MRPYGIVILTKEDKEILIQSLEGAILQGSLYVGKKVSGCRRNRRSLAVILDVAGLFLRAADIAVSTRAR